LFHPQDGNTYTTRVVFYKTYMPPHHLFGYNESQARSHGVHIDILDWRSKSKEQLVEDLFSKEERDRTVDRELLSTARENQHRGQQAVLFRQTGPGQYERYF
jgi:phosphatidylinositol glycan class Z